MTVSATFTTQTEWFLYGADKLIDAGLKTLDDGLDEYIEAKEKWTQSKSMLSGMSYASGASDLSAITGGAKDAVAGGDNTSGGALLESSRKSALQSRDALRTIVGLLNL